VDYAVTFYAHLRGGVLANGLPPRVESSATFRTVPAEQHPQGVDERAQLENYLESQAVTLAKSSGMYAAFDVVGDEKSDKEWGRGKFVPMHMIRYISYSVRRLVGLTPSMNDEKVVLN
jgi:hypothetical protein